jgi:replicative DNA helicase Mcm
MLVELTEEDMVTKWGEFLEEYDYRGKIIRISDNYPDEKSLFVSFTDLNRYDTDMTLGLFESPQSVLKPGEEAIKRMLPPGSEAHIHLRITQIPKDAGIEIRSLRSKNLGKFVSVEGLVKRATDVRPKIFRSVFLCARCNAKIDVWQEGNFLQDPLECLTENEGGCGRSASQTRFKLIPEESSFIDTQRIEIQEKPERLRGGEMPQRLVAFLEDDLTGVIWPGARIELNGVLRSHQLRRSATGGRGTLFDIFLDANSIEKEKEEFEDLEVRPEDIEEFKKVASDEGIFRKLVNSVCPTMYGLDVEKESLALQLFGGVPKSMKDGTKIRGDMHMLLVGDPGTGKSQILSYMSGLAPRGIYTSGKSSTAAGLTAAAVKEGLGDGGRWTLEAGTVVLADKGLACIDELDKMDEKDRSSIHEAMEQQTVSVAKAGIQASLPARCSVLGAANFKLGRYDPNKTIPEQINLPATLLSRFDVIYSLIDKPDSVKDGDMADHILREHWVGEIMRRRETGEELEIEDFEERYIPQFDPTFLRKYIAYAKSIFPILTEEAMTLIKENYLNIRKQGEGEAPTVPITPRQLEAYVRLSEASARARLSQTVERDDAQRAVRIMDEWLRRIAGTAGTFDIDIVLTGISSSQRSQISVLREVIERLGSTTEEGFVPEGEITREAQEKGLPGSKVESLLARLSQEGMIIRTPKGIKMV